MTRTGGDWKKYRETEIPSTLLPFDEFYEHFREDQAILDLGCGFGRTCHHLRARGFQELYGLDVNPAGLAAARRTAESVSTNGPPPRFVQGDAAFLPFAGARLDGVLMQAFLTTVAWDKDRRRVIGEIGRVLRRPGLVYLAEFGMNGENPVYRRRYEDGRRLGLEPGAFEVIDPATGRREFTARHFTRDELDEWLGRAGFAVQSYRSRILTTRTGNRINGHVFVARIE